MQLGRTQSPQLPPGPAADLVDLFRRLAVDARCSNRRLAERAGISPSYLSEVLRGLKAPAPVVAARIARALGARDADVFQARRLAEALQELKRYERAVARVDGVSTLPHRHKTYVAFLLSLDAAHHALRNIDVKDSKARRGQAIRAVHDAEVYANRERVLAIANKATVAAAEAAFLALVQIRRAFADGATVSDERYHTLYHVFAEAVWRLRAAVRHELGAGSLTPDLVGRTSWSDRDFCLYCSTTA